MQELILETASSVIHKQKDFELYDNFLSTDDVEELLLAFGWLEELKIKPSENKLNCSGKIANSLLKNMTKEERKLMEEHWNKQMLEKELQKQILNKIVGAEVKIEAKIMDDFYEEEEDSQSNEVKFEDLAEDFQICFEPIKEMYEEGDSFKILNDSNMAIATITKKEFTLSRETLAHFIAAAKTQKVFGRDFFLGIYPVSEDDSDNATKVRLTFLFKK